MIWLYIYWSSWSNLNWKRFSLFFFHSAQKPTQLLHSVFWGLFQESALCKAGSSTFLWQPAHDPCSTSIGGLYSQKPTNPWHLHGFEILSSVFLQTPGQLIQRKSTENQQHLCYVTVPVSKKPWCLSSSISPKLSGMTNLENLDVTIWATKKPNTSHYTRW